MAELRDATSDVVYRPLAGLAIAGFVVSCLFGGVVLLSTLIAIYQGAPFFFDNWTLLIAVAGFVLSWLGLVQIRNSEGTRAGQKLATYGLWISVVTGAGYFAYAYFTGLALGQQANRFFLEYEDDSGFFPRLQKAGKDKVELNNAFLLTLPPNERLGVHPDQQTEMIRLFDKPSGESPGMLSRFREEKFVMGLGKGGADAHVEPLGMQNWSYEKRSYKVTCLYRVKTPEFVAVMSIAARSSEGEVEGQSRQWFVDMTTVRDQGVEKTRLGQGLTELRKEAVAYLEGLAADLRKHDKNVDLAGADATDWSQLEVAGDTQRKSRVLDILAGRVTDNFWNLTVKSRDITDWDRDEQGRISLAIPFDVAHAFKPGPLTDRASGIATVRTKTPVDPEARADSDARKVEWELRQIKFHSYRQSAAKKA